MDLKTILKNIESERKRSGLLRAISQTIYYLLNQLICFRRLEIIYLTRDTLTPLDPKKYGRCSTRLANREDLVQLRRDGQWMITDSLIKGFDSGDSCILGLFDGKISGYTWIHDAGHPELTPGLSIHIPTQYAYNFAGFTHPDYRGHGLQPYRHYSTINRPEWKDKLGMIGFVEANNFSSKKGQAKSGYQPLGTITLIGTQKKFYAIFSSELRKLGIKRIKPC